MKMHRAATLFLVLFAGVAGCSAPMATDIPDGAATLEVREFPAPVAQYFHTGIDERQRIVLRDAQSWAQLWARLTAPYSPTPATPEVDFASEMIVVAAMGPRPSGGYSIHVDEAAEAEGRLYVSVREVAPGADCMVTAALTSPLVAVRIPRREGRVTFVERAETRRCD